LDGSVIALVKDIDCIYAFHSHARNCFGHMPDSNGTAVVMKCPDVSKLEKYLRSLSMGSLQV